MTQGWVDRVQFLPVSGGTGNFVVASAVQGYLTPALANAVNGTLYHYVAQIADNTGAITDWEVGTGAYTSGTTTLARTSIEFSSNANAAVNFSSPPTVTIDALAADFPGGLTLALADVDFYVDASTGSDSNDGSVGAPWLTIQHGVDIACSTQCTSAGVLIRIFVAAGTYNESVYLGYFVGAGVEGGGIQIHGASAASCSIASPGTDPAVVCTGGSYALINFTVSAPGLSLADAGVITCFGGNSYLGTGTIIYGTSGGAHNAALFGGYLYLNGTSTVTGTGTEFIVSRHPNSTVYYHHGQVVYNLDPGYNQTIRCNRQARVVYDVDSADSGSVATNPQLSMTQQAHVIAVVGEINGTSLGTISQDSILSDGATADITAPSFAGDLGSGGLIGYVPAPASGDAAAGKFLKADATWAVPAGSSGLTVGTTTIASGTTTRILYDNAGILGEYTATAATAFLNPFTSLLQGVAPASAGGTTNFLRADGSWAAPPGTSVGANPTATAKDTAVNGAATTFMRSDAAPAVQLTSSSQFGLCKVDNSTITASAGVISAVGAAATLIINSSPITGSTAKDFLYGDGSVLQQSTKFSLNTANVGTGNPNIVGLANYYESNGAIILGLDAVGGFNNLWVGNSAGFNTLAGDRNVIIGLANTIPNAASRSVMIGSSNTFAAYANHVAIGAYNTGITFWADPNNANIGLGFNCGNYGTVAGGGNVSIGNQSGKVLTSGGNNVCIGNSAGIKVTTGADNTLIGDHAGANLTTEGNNICIGQSAGQAATGFNNDIVIGYQAGLNSVATGGNNVGIGQAVLANMSSTASANVALGQSCLFSSLTGTNNLAIGSSALHSLTSGVANVGVGINAGGGTSVGNSNVFMGTSSGLTNTGGSNNVFIGASTAAAGGNSSYTSNVGIGTSALNVISASGGGSNGSNNVAVGQLAGSLMTTGYDNTFIGGNCNPPFLTTGSQNTFIGANISNAATSAGAFNGNGYVFIANGFGTVFYRATGTAISIGQSAIISGSCVIIGDNAGSSGPVAGVGNTIIGYNCNPPSLTSGINNTIIGANISNAVGSIGNTNPSGAIFIANGNGDGSLWASDPRGIDNLGLGFAAGHVGVCSGTHNLSLGNGAGGSLTTGSSNTCVGVLAGQLLTTGSANTLVGAFDSVVYPSGAGYNITTGSNNTIVGNYLGTATMAHQVVLADGAQNIVVQYDQPNKTFVTATTTIGALPAAGVAGRRAFVTDSLAAPIFAAALTAGGTVTSPVYDDGAAWRYG